MDKTVLVRYQKNPNQIRMTITPGKPDGVMDTVIISGTNYHLIGDENLKEQHFDAVLAGEEREFLDGVTSTITDILDIVIEKTNGD